MAPRPLDRPPPRPPDSPLRLATTVAAATVAATSSGEAVLLAVLLGLAAAELGSAVVAATAVVAFALRWGSTSLDAIAGAQAVLGPGGSVGPAGAVAATWCAAVALVVAAPAGWPAIAFGAAAALGVAGPAPGGPADIAVRMGATAAGVAVALVAGRLLPRRPAQAVGIALAGVALLLAVAS